MAISRQTGLRNVLAGYVPYPLLRLQCSTHRLGNLFGVHRILLVQIFKVAFALTDNRGMDEFRSG